MGQRASDTRGVTFEDVVVPKKVKKLICILDLNLVDFYENYL